MNGHPLVSFSVPDICNGVYILFVLVTILASWRERRRHGRRVELWSDDTARRQALLEAGASPAVAEQIVQRHKINAIKVCRLETGLGLAEAKELVERYENTLYRYEPWNTHSAH